MTRLDEINELYRFNTWAQKRMFVTTAALTVDELTRDMKNSFPSVRDTLIHSVSGDWVWLTRWQGTSPTEFPNADDLKTHEHIVARWRAIDTDRRAYLASLDEDSLDRVVAYTSFAGLSFAFPFWQMLRHVVNHATYHRGQVTTMVRQLGHTVQPTDMILLYQEEQKAAAQKGLK